MRTTCPHCLSVLEVADSALGQPTICPSCQTTFVVPAPEPTDLQMSDVAESAAEEAAQPDADSADSFPSVDDSPPAVVRYRAVEREIQPGLVDMQFKRLLSPMLVGVIYLLGIAMVGVWAIVTLATTGFVIANSQSHDPSQSIMLLIGLGLNVTGAVISLMFLRVWCEAVLAFFRMEHTMNRIEELLANRQSDEDGA